MFALGLDLHQSATPKISIPAEVTALAEKKRWAAKLAKDFAAADALRKNHRGRLVDARPQGRLFARTR